MADEDQYAQVEVSPEKGKSCIVWIPAVRAAAGLKHQIEGLPGTWVVKNVYATKPRSFIEGIGMKAHEVVRGS